MKIDTPTAHVFLQGDMIVVKYKENARVELPVMLAIHEAEKKLTKEKMHLALLDARGFISVSNDARKFGASAKPSQYRRAAALLVNTMGVKMLGNFYLNFNRPKVPTRMFMDERKAIDWLKGL